VPVHHDDNIHGHHNDINDNEWHYVYIDHDQWRVQTGALREFRRRLAGGMPAVVLWRLPAVPLYNDDDNDQYHNDHSHNDHSHNDHWPHDDLYWNDHNDNHYRAVLCRNLWLNFGRLAGCLLELVLQWLSSVPVHDDHDNDDKHYKLHYHDLHDHDNDDEYDNIHHHNYDLHRHYHHEHDHDLHDYNDHCHVRSGVHQFRRWLARGLQSVVLCVLPAVPAHNDIHNIHGHYNDSNNVNVNDNDGAVPTISVQQHARWMESRLW
jgi:hypothetical protein